MAISPTKPGGSDLERLIDTLLADRRLAPHLRYRGLEEGRGPRFAEPEGGLDPDARRAMAALGATRLYRHQAEALERMRAGQHVLLATPTASGKTLAYLLAFLELRRRDPEARALFVYPLKALARDQLAAIRRALGALGIAAPRAAEVYDGDTPEPARRRIRREPPAIVVTNPDMLHLGIVPSHDAWGGFMEHLALVAVDEAHVYRGLFGAHVHHVLRRLVRLARRHGGDPRFVAGSATIGDAAGFARTLLAEEVGVVSDSGAPVSPRHVLFFEPEQISPYTLATELFARIVGAGHKTIAFTKARRITELMHQWVREQHPELSSLVASYRSGYLPEERRAIEGRLFSGDLRGVLSTSALEAGIDVGGLDAAILVGYPGSLATAWQRIGRAGRSEAPSLAALVAMPDALDRYVVAHPEHFFSGEFERVVLDPDNDHVADAHLASAGAESSLDADDLGLLGGVRGVEPGLARVRRLVEEGKLVEAHDDERWFSLRRKPQRDIPLRAAGQPYALRLASSGRELGSLDEGRAWFEGHPGAIYLHAGQTYRSLDLNPDERVVLLERAEVDYYTQVYARKETEILERLDERELGGATLCLGRLRVTTTVEGYGRRRLFTQEEISRHEIEGAPPQVLETLGFWVRWPATLLEVLAGKGLHPVGALHAAEHAAIGLFPLLAICDRWDLGGISYAHQPQEAAPAVFVYDGYPGGVGLARAGFARAEDLLARTSALVAGCPCEDGCPACVISPKCGSGNHPLDKEGARFVLDAALGREALEAPEESQADVVAEYLARHRRREHGGVRGSERRLGAEGGPGPAAPASRGPVDAKAEGAPGFDEGAGTPPAGPWRPTPARMAEVWWPDELPHPDALLRAEEGRVLFFDLETERSADEVGGWGQVDKMGLALGVTLDAREGLYTSWGADDAEALADALLAADLVVGFNVDRFDLGVLEGLVGDRVRGVRTLDMLTRVHERLGFRLGLGHLAETSLGVGKSADGLQSLAWVRAGRMELVERYCRDDVARTAALWAYGRTHRYLLFRSREGLRGRIPVEW